MQKENAIQVINSRNILPTAGQFQVKVTNVTAFERKNTDGSTTSVGICNYAAMTPYQLQETKKLLMLVNKAEKAGAETVMLPIRNTDGEFIDTELSIEDAWQACTNQNLSSSQRLGTDFVPNKGDIVNVVLDFIDTKNQTNALLVIGCQPLRTTHATKASISLDDETDELSLVDSADSTGANKEKLVERATQKGAEKIAEQAPAI